VLLVNEPQTAAPGTTSIGVAVAQFAPGMDKTANLDKIALLTKDASAAGAQLVVFPEFSAFMTPTLDARIVGAAEPQDGPFVSALGSLARQHEINIVAGMNERVAGRQRIHNTLVFIDRDGQLAGTYRKVHLFDAFGHLESDWVLPGPVGPVSTIAVDGVRLGLQTCFDIRFPESTRALTDQGVDVVLVAAQWVPGPLKDDHWITLLRARAIENTVYVAASDQIGPLGCGRSIIVDPMGVVLADLGAATDVACVDLDLDHLDAVRRKLPVVRARRFATVPAPTRADDITLGETQ